MKPRAKFSVLLLAVGAVLTFAGCSRGKIERVEWTTMGTVAAVQTKGGVVPPEMLETVKAEFERVNAHFNVHDPKAPIHEIALISDAGIQSYDAVFPYACYAEALVLRNLSGSAFNPRWRGPDTLDMGAIAKGFAVDLAADAVRERDRATGGTMPDMLIDLGGNLFAVKGSWRTGIAGSEMTLELAEGFACATSAEYYRGKHIYDGRTGLAVSNGVESVTVVVGGSAMEADGLSTTLFVLGPDEGRRFLDEKWRKPGVRAIWFMSDGTKIGHLSGSFAGDLGTVP